MNKKNIIKYLDGFRLKHSILASAKQLDQKQEDLNRINVFPVADGDTGTNMAETMQAIADRAQHQEDDSFAAVSTAIADSALEGARGNSGVILAQFFQGLADKVVGKKKVATHEFAQAVDNAVSLAHSAVTHPREGTILTVMRDWADFIKEHAQIKTDFVDLLKSALVRAKHSLAETPKKLKELRIAGVVDAGAQGFVHILEGMQDFLESGRLAAMTAATQMVDKIRHHTHNAEEAALYQYCTQCLIQGEDINRDLLKQELSLLGESLIVIGTHHKVRIHIHTNHPQQVFNIAEYHGRLIQSKTDDMRSQFSKKLKEDEKEMITVVTDSTCDLPEEFLRLHQVRVVPVLLKIRDKSFIDRVEIQPEEFYQLYKVSGGQISTSQPSPASFTQAYQSAVAHSRSILSIHLSGAISGTINGARIAARPFADATPIDIIDSRATSVGLGLIVQEAVRLIARGFDREQINRELQDAVRRLRFFVSMPSLKQVIKSGRVPKFKGWLGELIGVKAVLTFDDGGNVVEAEKVLGLKAVQEKVLELTTMYAVRLKNPRFGIAHVMNRSLAEAYRQTLSQQFATDDIFIVAASPALGAHVGFGACGIAVLGDHD
ncbi:MAG: DegV family EDD domain-containing protein [Calditrichaeota bacterium]|nr:MAG: DegV family EDD domain-containing protein [Calditrichota bacterium]